MQEVFLAGFFIMRRLALWRADKTVILGGVAVCRSVVGRGEFGFPVM